VTVASGAAVASARTGWAGGVAVAGSVGGGSRPPLQAASANVRHRLSTTLIRTIVCPLCAKRAEAGCWASTGIPGTLAGLAGTTRALRIIADTRAVGNSRNWNSICMFCVYESGPLCWPPSAAYAAPAHVVWKGAAR